MEAEFKNICRICLEDGETDLFAVHDGCDFLQLIYECFKVSILYDKDKPRSICKDCISKLNLIHAFREQCTTIDKRFSIFYKEFVERNTFKEEINLENSLISDDDETDHNYSELNAPNTDKDTVIETSENSLDIQITSSNFKCNLCNKVLKTKTSLQKHFVSMHEKRKHIGKVSGFGAARRYHCTTCSYSTPHSQTLVNHMRRHNGERPYVCECGKSFTQSSSLTAHRKTHSTTTYFTCSLCGKQFKLAFAMKNHLRVHEHGRFACSICFKILKSKQSLKSHMRRHYNICNYNCEDCGDTFVTSSELLNHRRTHSLEKKVECNLCGYKTHRKKNLIIHLKRHSGNRSFKCNMCQVAFYTQGDLQRHQRVHSRDKPFSCPTCNQKFTYSPSLNKHMKTVHGVDYKWADIKWRETKVIKLAVKADDLINN